MKQGIRALSWTITIAMLLVIVFVATALYSVMNVFLFERNLEINDFQINVSDNALELSSVISVNNTGYYAIDDFNVTTQIKDLTGDLLSKNSTFIQRISTGTRVNSIHSVSLKLDELMNKTYLLFDDSELQVDFNIRFSLALAFSFKLLIQNTTLPWGAPLYLYNVTNVEPTSFNGTHLVMNITQEGENHSLFDVNGTLYIEVFNEAGGYVGNGSQYMSIPSQSNYYPFEIDILVVNPVNFSGTGYVMVYFTMLVIDHRFEIGRIGYG